MMDFSPKSRLAKHLKILEELSLTPEDILIPLNEFNEALTQYHNDILSYFQNTEIYPQGLWQGKDFLKWGSATVRNAKLRSSLMADLEKSFREDLSEMLNSFIAARIPQKFGEEGQEVFKLVEAEYQKMQLSLTVNRFLERLAAKHMEICTPESLFAIGFNKYLQQFDIPLLKTLWEKHDLSKDVTKKELIHYFTEDEGGQIKLVQDGLIRQFKFIFEPNQNLKDAFEVLNWQTPEDKERIRRIIEKKGLKESAKKAIEAILKLDKLASREERIDEHPSELEDVNKRIGALEKKNSSKAPLWLPLIASLIAVCSLVYVLVRVEPLEQKIQDLEGNVQVLTAKVDSLINNPPEGGGGTVDVSGIERDIQELHTLYIDMREELILNNETLEKFLKFQLKELKSQEGSQ